jgi:hypothetical protein
LIPEREKVIAGFYEVGRFTTVSSPSSAPPSAQRAHSRVAGL